MTRAPEALRKFAGYLLSGGGAALVDIGLFHLLAPAIGVIPGAALSFLIAAICNYLASARYVFGHAQGLRHGLIFLAFAGLGLIINVSATAAIFSAFHPPLVLAKAGGVGVAFLFNFAANYLIVFRRRSGAPPRDAAPLHRSIPNL